MKLKNPEFADTKLKMLCGLMFRKHFPEALVFNTGSPIHSFFVKFPFDVVFLDEKKKVVDSYENVRPYTRRIASKRRASYIVEFPPGTIKRKKIKLGTKIEW